MADSPERRRPRPQPAPPIIAIVAIVATRRTRRAAAPTPSDPAAGGEQSPPARWWHFALRDRRLALIAAFGFYSGLPLPLSGFTLQQWLSEGHLSLQSIGLTANLGLAYTLKFLWAPLLDQVPPPGPFRRAGRRRGWLLAIQPLLALSILALANSQPTERPSATLAIAAAIAFFSASQDIVVDAWRVETFPERLQGLALASYVWGYRVALLVAGAGAIGLASGVGWRGSLGFIAALAGASTLLTLLAPEPIPTRRLTGRTGIAAQVHHAVVDPFLDFWRRPRAVQILAFIMLFKLGEALAHTMAAPFYRSLGFDRSQVALATGLPGLAASLLGAAFGGWLVIRVGTGRALISTGFVQMASMGLYFALAVSHGDTIILFAKIVFENFAEAMADAAFLTYLSSLCSPAFTATQYALLSSLAAVGLRTLGGLSGWLAAALGWIDFYALTIAAALPAMLLMLSLRRGTATDAVKARQAGSAAPHVGKDLPVPQRSPGAPG